MKKAVILDTSAIMYRTHFALMGMRNSKGLATGATYGFVNTLEGVLKEFSPDYLVACLDIKRSELKRSEELETYKAHRESMPEDLVAQQEYIMSVLEGYKIFICQNNFTLKKRNSQGEKRLFFKKINKIIYQVF